MVIIYRFHGWAVAAGAIPLVGLILAAALHRAGMEEAMETVAPGLSVLLAVWWAAAALSLTFHAPFLVAGNGYFATWGAFAAAVALAFNSNRHLENVQRATEQAKTLAQEQRSCAVLVASASVGLLSVVLHCLSEGESCEGDLGWGLFLCLFTVLLGGLCLTFRQLNPAFPPICLHVCLTFMSSFRDLIGRGAILIGSALSLLWAITVRVF